MILQLKESYKHVNFNNFICNKNRNISKNLLEMVYFFWVI